MYLEQQEKTNINVYNKKDYPHGIQDWSTTPDLLEEPKVFLCTKWNVFV